MNRQSGRPKILAIAGARIASIELGAVIPFTELEKLGACFFRFKVESALTFKDIVWCDILFVARGISDHSVWAIQEAKRLGRLVLGWWDDDLMNIPVHSQSHAFFSSPEIKKNIRTIFELSDAFFSPSPRLAFKLTTILGRKVEVLPEPIGGKLIRPEMNRNMHIPVIGFSGSIDHQKYLNRLLGPAFIKAAGNAVFKVHIVGPSPDFFNKLPVETNFSPYIQNYYKYLAFAANLNWDIGLAPQMDDEYANCKYHVKLLEYTHIRCAGIYSKTKLYSGVIEDGVNGLLAENSPAAWKDAIVRLVRDPDLRYKIICNAYEYVKSHHSREVVADTYASVLKPYLAYRAPEVNKLHTIINDIPGQVVRTLKRGVRYGKEKGVLKLMRMIPRYLHFRIIALSQQNHEVEFYMSMQNSVSSVPDVPRLPRVLVLYAGMIPSVELAAIIPFTELQKQGLCVFKCVDEPSFTINDIIWCDILFMMRGASPTSVLAVQTAKNLDRLVIGYWDDDFLSIPPHNVNYPYYQNPEIRINIKTIFELADAFFSPSKRLCDKITAIRGKPTQLTPGILGAEVLNPPRATGNNPPVIGFSGSIVYLGQLNQLVGPALNNAAEVSKFKVHIMGPKPDFIDHLPFETVFSTYISDYHKYLAFAAKLNWDIGLAPQVDEEFANCKFYNKLLEYTYIGCAGIYSKVDLYSGVIEDGVTGLLVENEVAAWKDAIVRLVKDSKLRRKIVNNAYEYVNSRFTRKPVTEQYVAALAQYFKHRAPVIVTPSSGLARPHIVYEKKVGKTKVKKTGGYRNIFGFLKF